MKLAYACNPAQGGSGIVASELAAEIARRGHEVHLMAPGRPFRMPEDAPVRLHPVVVAEHPIFPHPPDDLALINGLAGLVLRQNIELIHAHFLFPYGIAALLARHIARHPVRVVVTLHGTDVTVLSDHDGFRELACYALRYADALTAVSGWLADAAVRHLADIPPPVVIPNFIDCSRFHSRGRVSHPGPGGEFHLVHASNLRPVKRVGDVIEVFARVARELPARLTVVGDGPERDFAERLVSRLDLGERVRFLGATRDIADVYRSAHLYLSMSEQESFGLSALEAMVCGTPVAGAGTGGIAEVVGGGMTGLLGPAGDLGCTSRRIVDLLRDPERWARISRAAAHSARERFRSEAVVPLYEAFYKSVISGQGSEVDSEPTMVICSRTP